jgi:hypothetical protein
MYGNEVCATKKQTPLRTRSVPARRELRKRSPDARHDESPFRCEPAVVAIAGPGTGALAAHVDHPGRTGSPAPLRAPAATPQTPAAASRLGPDGDVAGRLEPLDPVRTQAVFALTTPRGSVFRRISLSYRRRGSLEIRRQFLTRPPKGKHLFF